MKTDYKEVEGLGMPWEEEYGYAQAVRKGGIVWLAGQVGHDESGTLAEGMESQVRQSYANIRKLLQGFDMSMDDIVEEVVYTTDIEGAFAARKLIGREYYADPASVASTLVEVRRLTLEHQLVEIKITATR